MIIKIITNRVGSNSLFKCDMPEVAEVPEIAISRSTIEKYHVSPSYFSAHLRLRILIFNEFCLLKIIQLIRLFLLLYLLLFLAYLLHRFNRKRIITPRKIVFTANTIFTFSHM